MPRQVSPSQLRSMIRQAEQKQRQAINSYNRAIDKYNREAKGAVATYNSKVQAHNSRVRVNRRNLKRELERLARQPLTYHGTYRVSTQSLHEAYQNVESQVQSGALGSSGTWILDLSEREAANSVAAMNALLETVGAPAGLVELKKTSLEHELSVISPELDRRWHGALYALDPANPDAARHFCASSREVLTRLIDYEAPDNTVLDAIPQCAKTREGKPTRRTKIEFILSRKGINNAAVARFVEHDIDNVVALFSVFNEGTHGPAGKFDLGQLASIKTRVEDAIRFLNALAR